MRSTIAAALLLAPLSAHAGPSLRESTLEWVCEYSGNVGAESILLRYTVKVKGGELASTCYAGTTRGAKDVTFYRSLANASVSEIPCSVGWDVDSPSGGAWSFLANLSKGTAKARYTDSTSKHDGRTFPLECRKPDV